MLSNATAADDPDDTAARPRMIGVDGAAMITLTAGDYVATVSTVGAALATLQHAGRDLVLDCGANPRMPPYRGAVLAPWPNRIADGRYVIDGVAYQLPINEVARNCALHGLLVWSTWQVAQADPSSVVLTNAIASQPGYPYPLAVEASYRLDARTGLTLTVAARNQGRVPAPYGVSIHPHLVAGAGTADDWTLDLDAGQVLEVDPARLLPTEVTTVDGTPLDFRGGRRIGAVRIDNAFTQLGATTATLTDPDGGGVRMTWDDTCHWVQVHTTDLAGHEANRRGLAFEPMTCPPDAFNSGVDVVLLEPAGTHTAWWRIEAVVPAGGVSGP